MAELTTQALPLLPLPAGVILPQSVVTLVLETDEAQAAVATALDADRRLLLVPRIDGQFARVGTVARVEDSGDLPNGMGAVVLLIATISLFAGAQVLGWGLSFVVIALAAVNLFFGFCAGCFVYFQLQRLRR